MVGIIAEYNPFHNGHVYHIKKVKEMFPNETICLVLAGHFLNRGDISIINKWDKTSLALEYGVDLVVELPFMFASQAADIYAYGAISILNNLKADYIVFGSESDDIEKLKKIANIKEDKNYQNKLQEYLKQGFNYPTSISKVNKDLLEADISSPNDLLGISYIKSINKLNSHIIPMTIKRTNNYHDLALNANIVSASSIRNAITENKDIHNYVPKETIQYINDIRLEQFFDILKHQILIDDITKYQTVDDKLANSLKKHILSCNSLEELIKKTKTKNITYNKIKRSLVHILCGFTKKEAINELTYIRILGFNILGKQYLNKIKKEINVPIYSKYEKIMDLELRVTKIYSLITDSSIINKEIKNIIIK